MWRQVLKTVQCTVWVAATSDEVHSTQGLLEAQGDSQRLGKGGNREGRKSSVTPEVRVKYQH